MKVVRALLGRWIGIALILAAAAFFIVSGRPVPIKGPVETAKSNYIVVHSFASRMTTFLLGSAGVILLVRFFKTKHETEPVA
jgi:hypothetical protein